ncbi:hypothetical protein D2T32_04420 [Sinirhodobacter populi]|nr:hypothetical protein D2T32_04420 [Sinirhodobacter populi]
MANVFGERLWRAIKCEGGYLRAGASVSEARAGIARYPGFSNSRLPHSSPEGTSPIPLRSADARNGGVTKAEICEPPPPYS